MSKVQNFRHVLVIEDRKGRRIISLEEDSYTIGRDSQNQIVLYDYQGCSKCQQKFDFCSFSSGLRETASVLLHQGQSATPA